MKLERSRQIFEKKKLRYENSSKSVLCEQSCSVRRTDGQTDMTKPIVAFHNFAKASENLRFLKMWFKFRMLAVHKFNRVLHLFWNLSLYCVPLCWVTCSEFRRNT